MNFTARVLYRTIRLSGARVATGADTSERIDLTVRAGRIFFPASAARKDEPDLDLSGCLLLPGLINAHDHLEFGLFPRLGRRIYANASEWASDIYRPDASPLKEHLAVPKPVRLAWGAIRNLLSGVTTVAHHNPWEPGVFDECFPVRVVRNFGWAHSLAYSPDLVQRFHGTPQGWPFIIHAAEGTDETAREEMRRLDELGLLGPRTVLVHAIGLAPGDPDTLLRRRCSIVWCPRSNLSTYGQTLTRETLRSGIPVALGTDSSLTTEGDLVNEIRTARVEGALTPAEVYTMVTALPAAILGLKRGEGFIAAGGVADLVAVADHGQTPAEAIFDLSPQLMLLGGRPVLVSEPLAKGVLAPFVGEFEAIHLDGRGRWLIDARVSDLHREAVKAIGPDCRLAGRLVYP
jgi:cytosine/adenosine deaminase-related metal-dependent hydrolase